MSKLFNSHSNFSYEYEMNSCEFIYDLVCIVLIKVILIFFILNIEIYSNMKFYKYTLYRQN